MVQARDLLGPPVTAHMRYRFAVFGFASRALYSVQLHLGTVQPTRWCSGRGCPQSTQRSIPPSLLRRPRCVAIGTAFTLSRWALIWLRHAQPYPQ